MNSNIENIFVKRFIKKSVQERLLYELKSKKKRLNAILRFNHNTELIINTSSIYAVKKFLTKEQIIDFLKCEDVYILSYKHLNGIIMHKREAAIYTLEEYSSVLLCGEDRVIIKSECENGSKLFYLLTSRANGNNV